MDLLLNGSVVVVTGGSSGIGLATVARLGAEGARVATCARDHTRLERAVEQLGDDGPVLTDRCDVTDEEQVRAFVERVQDELGGIDGLVLNAGRSRMARWHETTFAEWREELELKLGGVLHPLQAALPALRRSEHGAVVSVNAVLSRQPEPRLAATSAARASLLNLTRTLATELAGDRVRMNSVLLGLIDTGQWRRRYEESDSGASFAEWSADVAAERGIGLGRFGTAEEVADMIAVLLSPVASYVTGASLEVDGGVARYV